MDGVSSAASVIAVVTLAVQLGQTIQKINKFLQQVEEAPREVVRLIETLDQLHGTLDHVRELLEQQYLVLRLPGSPLFITRALETCEKHISELTIISNSISRSFGHQRKMRRTWASMRLVVKKQDLDDIRCRLRDAKMDLQSAISSNLWHLQLHQIRSIREEGVYNQVISNANESAAKDTHNRLHEASVSNYHYSNLAKNYFPVSKETIVPYYRGVFGTVTLRKKMKYSNPRTRESSAVVSDSAWTIQPPFIGYMLELRYIQSFKQISRTLNVYPVLRYGAVVFGMCKEGDVQGLQELLSEGTVSPFVSNEAGWTLLHYAALHARLEVCTFLLHLGVDPDRVDENGHKPLHKIGYRFLHSSCDHTSDTVCHDGAKEDPSDTVRLLAQKQDCVSSEDLSKLMSTYFGPPGLAEFIISKDFLDLALFDSANEPINYPPLAMALHWYAVAYLAEHKYEHLNAHEMQHRGELDQWESLIRRLLRTGADLHKCIYHCGIEYVRGDVTCEIPEYGTPLDDIFTHTNTPAESRAVANSWLEILRSEGYDVIAYIEKEYHLHYTRPQIILPFRPHLVSLGSSRELLFTFDKQNPEISWDWWIDPASSTYLIRSTFKPLLMLSDWMVIDETFWEQEWPFRNPPWHEVWFEDQDIQYPFVDEEAWIKFCQLRDAANLRDNRRLQKRHAKEMRRRGLKYPKMPGAWHD